MIGNKLWILGFITSMLVRADEIRTQRNVDNTEVPNIRKGLID